MIPRNMKRRVEGYKKFCKKTGSSIQSILNVNSKNPINVNIYLISFCNEGDLLSQRKWYGKIVEYLFDLTLIILHIEPMNMKIEKAYKKKLVL